MQIYMMDSNCSYMAYWFTDDAVGDRLMGRTTGRVALPDPTDLPLQMAPSFGEAVPQPTALGDLHYFFGSRRLFSERAVDALALERTGHLFPVDLEGRSEQFFWYWSTCMIDCLDESRTKRLGSQVKDPAFFEDRIGDAEIFFTPDEQTHQRVIYVTESFRTKVKKAKLKGFMLKRSLFDPKPWKS